MRYRQVAYVTDPPRRCAPLLQRGSTSVNENKSDLSQPHDDTPPGQIPDGKRINGTQVQHSVFPAGWGGSTTYAAKRFNPTAQTLKKLLAKKLSAKKLSANPLKSNR